MSATLLANVQDQIQEFWSDIFVDEFKEMAKLPALVSRDYDGEIKEAGDSVNVSQINVPTANRRTIGTPGYENYGSTTMATESIKIVADTIIDAGYEINSLVNLQSQIKSQDSKIRQGLLKALEIEMNNWLYGLCSPSSATHDHIIDSVADFNDTQLRAARKIAADAHWPENDRWILASSSYINDMLAVTGLISSDFVTDNPVLSGRLVAQRHGFNIIEDTTVGMRQLSPTAAANDLALVFTPEFMYLVMQMQPTFKISDLHANRRRGYLLTVELVAGAKLGLDGALKHAKFYNS
jgi:hypothetical protein